MPLDPGYDTCWTKRSSRIQSGSSTKATSWKGVVTDGDDSCDQANLGSLYMAYGLLTQKQHYVSFKYNLCRGQHPNMARPFQLFKLRELHVLSSMTFSSGLTTLLRCPLVYSVLTNFSGFWMACTESRTKDPQCAYWQHVRPTRGCRRGPTRSSTNSKLANIPDQASLLDYRTPSTQYGAVTGHTSSHVLMQIAVCGLLFTH